MRVILARNVNDAFYNGLQLLHKEGQRQESRAGKVLVAPYPVVTEYHHPQERVLFRQSRDANPFFHLFEALWMLAGCNDATWLDRFVGDFSARFAEADGYQHGAYGFRWRHHFDIEGWGPFGEPDQIAKVIKLLKANPDDRRVVLTMWDPVADLGHNYKDIPCNTHAYVRVRKDQKLTVTEPACAGGVDLGPERGVLDLTVCCRSNDAIWGAYGANAVHFSVLQEYLAACIGVGIGTYYQISNNFHAYVDVLMKMDLHPERDPYQISANITPIVTVPDAFDQDLKAFMGGALGFRYSNAFFELIAIPMFQAHTAWKDGARQAAVDIVNTLPVNCDWRMAAKQWMMKRLKAQQYG